MDALLDAAPTLAAFVAGAGGALLAVRWRKRIPRVDVALDSAGIPGPCRAYADGEHLYDRYIADGRGWKCKCGARAPKKE